jgi:gas vesicle protein
MLGPSSSNRQKKNDIVLTEDVKSCLNEFKTTIENKNRQILSVLESVKDQVKDAADKHQKNVKNTQKEITDKQKVVIEEAKKAVEELKNAQVMI